MNTDQIRASNDLPEEDIKFYSKIRFVLFVIKWIFLIMCWPIGLLYIFTKTIYFVSLFCYTSILTLLIGSKSDVDNRRYLHIFTSLPVHLGLTILLIISWL